MLSNTFQIVVLLLGASAIALLGTTPASAQSSFGRVSVKPAFELDGVGQDIDTITFWETPDPEQTLLFVSAKASQLVEVWKFPFVGNEQAPLRHSSFGSGTRVNGVIFDQEKDRLYVATSKPASTVSVFSFPGGIFEREFIQGAHDLRSEPNLDLYFGNNGERRAYVTADNIVYVYNAETGEALFDFKPTTSVETVIADEFYDLLYIPDEKTGKGIFVFNPDGTPHSRNGQDHFGGGGIFDSDEEGLLLYTYPSDGSSDDGSGFIVVSDQKSDQTDFEFFDRQTWEHLGALNVDDVSNTDGIASTQRSLPGYPLGLFVCINNDGTTVGVGWDVILEATGLGPEDRGTGATISGKIQVANSTQSVDNATVRLVQSGQVRLETRSVADGSYELRNIPAAVYDLVASKPGFADSSQPVSVSEGQNLTNQNLQLAPLADVTPPAPPKNVQATSEQNN